MIEYMKKHQGNTHCPVCREESLKERDLVVVRQNETNGSGGSSKKQATGTYANSTKVDALLGALKELRAKDSSSKSVVFSQWTSMLDLLKEPLGNSGFAFLRLDGTVPQAKREEILTKFKTSDIPLLLVSLRAGGVGLNLTAANNCFLLDLWWNPAGEKHSLVFQPKPKAKTTTTTKTNGEISLVNSGGAGN